MYSLTSIQILNGEGSDWVNGWDYYNYVRCGFGIAREHKIILWISTIWLSAVVCKERPSSADTSLETLAATGTANERKCIPPSSTIWPRSWLQNPFPQRVYYALFKNVKSHLCTSHFTHYDERRRQTWPLQWSHQGAHIFHSISSWCPFVLTSVWKMPQSVLPLLKWVH